MNPIDAYLMEFEQESATTRRVLESVPDSKYGWSPNPKGKSMAELCGHIASIPAGMPQILGADSFDISQRPPPETPPANRAETLATHDAAVKSALEWMSGLGESAGESWRLMRGEEELMAMPRAVAIRFFLLNHLYHHRGQLSAYLRAAGEVVPSVYGPTADVDPFAP